MKILKGADDYSLQYAFFSRWPITLETDEGTKSVVINSLQMGEDRCVLFGGPDYKGIACVNPHSPEYGKGELKHHGKSNREVTCRTC